MTQSNAQNWKFETQQVHAGWDRDPATGATALPIHMSNGFAFESAEQAADRFSLRQIGNIYTRLSNPTNDSLEARVAALEGGVGALFLASGQSATALSILNLADTGNNIIASGSLYGGTVTLLKNSLGRLGIEVRFVSDPLNAEAWKALADAKTVAFFGEAIPNPRGDILDIEPIAQAAHEVGVPLIVDNTVSTPYLTRPFEWGADIVVHSASKSLGGHGTTMGGFIVDSGHFDYSADPKRFLHFNTPDPSYGGIIYARDLGEEGAFGANLSYILRARLLGQRDFGFVPSPFNAFLIESGIQTLSLRIERATDNALAVARYLEAHPQVESVNYAGLESSPLHHLHLKYCPRGAGPLLSFVIKGGYEAGRAFANSLELLPLIANLGDNKTLATHPASMTHSQLSPSQLEAAGIEGGTFRLSIGIEHIDDIIADLEIGFAAASTVAS